MMEVSVRARRKLTISHPRENHATPALLLFFGRDVVPDTPPGGRRIQFVAGNVRLTKRLGAAFFFIAQPFDAGDYRQ